MVQRKKREPNLLTAREVSNAKPARNSDAILLADGGNLYLQVTRGHGDHIRRSWLFRYERDGKRRELGLGALHTRGRSAEAREEAKRLRQLLLDGIDPLEHRSEAHREPRGRSGQEQNFLRGRRRLSQGTQGQLEEFQTRCAMGGRLTKDAKAIANLPVAAIDTAHVLEVLEPIWKTKPETASRTRGRIERVLAYAIVAKYRKREDGNPARWDGHLEELLGSKAKAQKAKRERTGKSGHHPALPIKDAPEFMAALRQIQFAFGARAGIHDLNCGED